jgi:UDPglucose--hexose-1-phosphate uridylyltransferase
MRLNPLTGRWVTIVAERARRPTDFVPLADELEIYAGGPCPFCPGSEDSTPPALETVDEGGGWRMRVVPNLYPAFDGESGFVVHHLGPVHVSAEASGIHEVFVYTHDHDGGIDRLDDEDAAEFMQALRRRLREHAAASGVRYTQVIINHGRVAGASLAHPHAQILGLPFVPGEILDEERAFARFAGGCVICTTIEAELADEDRVVFADDEVACVAPFWSGAPYELLLMPRRHELHLQDADTDSLEAMGRAIRDAVAHLESALGSVPYNLVFHTAPHEHSGEYHWHVHLWPNLVTEAGFERGTGVLINVMPPEVAAETLRAIRAPA